MTRGKRLFGITACGLAVVAAAVWLVVRPGAALGTKVRARAIAALGRLVPASDLGPEVRVSFTGTITLGPVALHLTGADGPADITVGRVVVSTAFASLFGSHPRVSHVHLDDVSVDLGDSPQHAQSTIDSYRAWRAQRPSPTDASGSGSIPSLSAERIAVALPLRAASAKARVIVLAALEAAAACNDATGCNAGVSANLERGGRITASISEKRADSVSAIVDTRLTDIDVAALPAALLAHVPVAIDRGRVDASLLASLSRDDAKQTSLDMNAEVTARDVTIEARRLADEPVVLARASATAHIGYRASDHRLVLDDAYIGLGNDERLRVHIDGEADTTGANAMAVHVRVRGIPCEGLFAAMPTAIAPARDEPRPRGELIAWLDLEGPAKHLDAWTLAGDIDTRAAHGDQLTGAEPLQASFTHIALDEHGNDHAIVVGPANPDFVPLAALPQHVIRAVTTSEDGGFYGHHGFDFAEIQNSLAQVTLTHKIRGGSTITQQLAKNLYLSHERTYARKIREAFIALALESTLGKGRMLEIYLNIIEWGPGLYGIGPAARHYFGKNASELEPKEAAFLASIIPNPVRYHGYFSRGELTDTWNTRVNAILDKMHTVGVLDDTTHEESVAAPVVFRERAN